MKHSNIQYTIRQVPSTVDAALRRKARRLRKSLNQVALEALACGTELDGCIRHADLDGFFGSWVEDSAVDKAFKDQRRIDEGLWA